MRIPFEKFSAGNIFFCELDEHVKGKAFYKDVNTNADTNGAVELTEYIKRYHGEPVWLEDVSYFKGTLYWLNRKGIGIMTNYESNSLSYYYQEVDQFRKSISMHITYVEP